MKNKKHSTLNNNALNLIAQLFPNRDGDQPEHTDPGSDDSFGYVLLDARVLQEMVRFCGETKRDFTWEIAQAVLDHIKRGEQKQRGGQCRPKKQRQALVEALPCLSPVKLDVLRSVDEPNLDWLRDDAEWGEFFEGLQ